MEPLGQTFPDTGHRRHATTPPGAPRARGEPDVPPLTTLNAADTSLACCVRYWEPISCPTCHPGQAAVFVAADHRSGDALRGAGADPSRCAPPLRAFEKDAARGLSVRHDHGSQYMSDHFQKELAFLAIES